MDWRSFLASWQLLKNFGGSWEHWSQLPVRLLRTLALSVRVPRTTCVVFNIGGNKYRLATRILYPSHVELVLDFPLASIKSDEHLAEAQSVMDGLLARDTRDAGEETYLDALSDLVGSYEDEHHAFEPASDAEMLRHLMEARGVSQMQLSLDTGLPKSTISEVLAGKKRFSRQMIRKLADYFHVDVGVLAANI